MKKAISAFLVVLIMLSSMYMVVSVTAENDEYDDTPTIATELETNRETEAPKPQTEAPKPQTEAPKPQTDADYDDDDDYYETTRRKTTKKTYSDNNERTSYQLSTANDEDDDGFVKTTRSIPSQTETQTTTQKAKNITDFGKKYNVPRWIAFVIMILSAGALVIINVRHHNMVKAQKARNARNGRRPQGQNGPRGQRGSQPMRTSAPNAQKRTDNSSAQNHGNAENMKFDDSADIGEDISSIDRTRK